MAPSKSIVGGNFQDALGNLITGNLLLVLPLDAQIPGSGQLAPKHIRIPVNGGVIAFTPIWFNDQLSPNNTSYIATVYDSTGNKVYGPEIWVLAGTSPLDLGLLTPALISPDPLFANPVLQNPSVPQTITGQPLTLTGSASLTANGGISASTVSATAVTAASLIGSGLTPGNCVQATTNGLLVTSSGPCGTSSGTLTATGSPVSGQGGFFSGATSLTGSANWTYAAASGHSLVQGANGADAFLMNRFTDTAPTGNFLRFRNTANNADVFKVDVLGNITANSITLAGGTGAYTNWGTTTSVCTTGSGAGSTCTFNITLNAVEVDTSYKITCTGTGPTQYPILLGVTNKQTSFVTVKISNGTSNMAQASTFNNVDCIITR